jgi:hypothetical protein
MIEDLRECSCWNGWLCEHERESLASGAGALTRRTLQPVGLTPDPERAPLVCAECGAEAPPQGRAWRAYLDDDGDAVMFCPECAERELGNGTTYR